MVGEADHLGNGPVAGHIRDEVVHLLADLPVGGMALRGGAQLDHVHRLTGVHLHQVPDPVGQRDGVGGLRGERIEQDPVEGSGSVHRLVETPGHASLIEVGWTAVAVKGRQTLPLDGQEPVTLEVPECAVVGEDVESVGRPLEGAPGPLSSVVAVSRQG